MLPSGTRWLAAQVSLACLPFFDDARNGWRHGGAVEGLNALRILLDRNGIERLSSMVEAERAPETVIALEATGSLHLPWASELERRFPGSLRLFAPSETQAARTQLGSRRFKDDDRDCAALVSLARQGRGRPAREGSTRRCSTRSATASAWSARRRSPASTSTTS